MVHVDNIPKLIKYTFNIRKIEFQHYLIYHRINRINRINTLITLFPTPCLGHMVEYTIIILHQIMIIEPIKKV